MVEADRTQAYYRWQKQSLILLCQLQPGASRDEFSGCHNGRLKIRITAAPVEGKANRHLIRFIASQFGVAKSTVSITRGEHSRLKTLRIGQPETVPAILDITPAI